MSRPDPQALHRWLQQQLESPALRRELWKLKDQVQFCARLAQAARLEITAADLEARCMAARHWWTEAGQWR